MGMGSKTYIDVEIDETGILEVTSHGFYGGKCKDVKKLVDGLGKVLESEHTDDVHRDAWVNREVVPVGTGRV